MTGLYAAPPTRTKELSRNCQWYAEWQKWLRGESANIDVLNSAYINWLGGYLRFTKESDGHIHVQRIDRSAPEHLPQVGLIGGLCGDVLGSYLEKGKDKSVISKEMEKLAKKNKKRVLAPMMYTDDTILSLAIANFQEWVKSPYREPYEAVTNGSAMRVAPVAWYAQSLDECLALAKTTAEVTHNSGEGIRGAQAIAAAIFLNRTGKSKDDIKSFIEQTFGYDLHRSTDEIRPTYGKEYTCDKSVPESIICFLEGADFMDTVIRAISLGGDTDTMACMAGNIAAATMPAPEDVALDCYNKLPQELREILDEWNNKYHQ